VTARDRIATFLHALAAEPPRRLCPDPVECGHEAALGQAREEIRRLGLMVDEYGAGASALSDKIQRVRALLDDPNHSNMILTGTIRAALNEPAPDATGPADLTGYIAPEPPISCLTVTAPASDDWPSRRAGLGDAIECAIGLNVDCGGTEGVHRVRDAVLTVLYREWPWLQAEAEDTEPNNTPPALREQLHDAIEHEVYEYRERVPLWGETEGVTEEITRLATRGALKALTANPAHTRDLIDTALRTTPRADCTDWPPREAHGQGHRYDMRCALCAGEADTLTDAVLAALQARPEPGQPKEPS
jgi:hypothetical protein